MLHRAWWLQVPASPCDPEATSGVVGRLTPVCVQKARSRLKCDHPCSKAFCNKQGCLLIELEMAPTMYPGFLATARYSNLKPLGASS